MTMWRISFLALVVFATSALAWIVPVFRGALAPAEQQRVESSQRATRKAHANLVFQTVDLAKLHAVSERKALVIAAGEKVPIAPDTPAPRAVEQPNPKRGMKLLASVTLAFLCIIVLLIGIVMLRSLRR